MKWLHVFTLLLAAALLLSGCGRPAEQSAAARELSSDTLYVKPVDLPEDFILGMDVSSVLAEEASGVKYYDFDGAERDLMAILAENGITHIRVRVWNHPYDAEGHGYGGGNNDIDAAVEIGKRATASGLKLIVDFHYSDFWADPGKQMVPLAWKDMKIEEKTEAAYEYTRDCLQQLKDAGVEVGMVQVGNETNGALCGETIWFNIQYIMQAGAKATREVYPEALVAVHFANPEKAGNYATYASKLDYYGVDYDVFATSYYPYWHGTLDNLRQVLGEISDTYGKKVMVMETSYAYTAEDSDFSGNTISTGGGIVKDYPFTVQGQANSVRNVAAAVASLEQGIGICYWEGAWITVGTESWEQNHELWETFGSGWASSYAAAYDPDDAGRYYGGSAVDNQTFFDPTGHPLESLKVFGLLRQGNEIAAVPDAVEDVLMTVDLTDTIVLPDTANAVMTDDSRQPVAVSWDVTEAELAAMQGGNPGVYEIHGRAGELPVYGRIETVSLNYLENGGFETGDLSGWTLTENGKADELGVKDNVTDSCEGTHQLHFWSADTDTVDFDLAQTVSDLKPGTYQYAISLMGGYGGETEIYAMVQINGEMVAAVPMALQGYGNWDTATVPGIVVGEGDELTLGIHVKCQGVKNGAWGSVDKATLNAVG